MPRQRILFVTGRLAENSLRRVLAEAAAQVDFDYEITVLPISVAALMHVPWVVRKLTIAGDFDRVIMPGWCQGELGELDRMFSVPFERGPKDVHDLPDYLGGRSRPPDLSQYDIEIVAEINHAPRLPLADVLRFADALQADGADVIDLGCVPGESWSAAGECVRMLKQAGHRVSIDSFDRAEVERAVAAGAELVLSCNGSNVDWATGLDAELVAIPDDLADVASLEATIERLEARGARYRLDPILEPIGHGFARSLERYFETRRRWPQAAIMMGVGNVSELTEVDSAGVNMLLAGFCQELRIHSVLTTQVVNWARTSVKELDVARRIMRHSMLHRVLPKHVDPRLVMLRDEKLRPLSDGEIESMASQITDPNYRILVQQSLIHLFNRDGHWQGTDAFELFEQALAASKPITAAHAFYLGYEMCKATIAAQLAKQYTQDESLDWGFLTIPERKHRGGHHQPSEDA